MKNEQFTTQYVDHFISNEPIPSVEDETQIYKMVVPRLSVDVVNSAVKQLICTTDTNLVSMVFMHEAEGAVYPTEQELADIVKQVRSEKLEAYVDNVKQEPLMAQAPKAGKIKKTEENKQLGFKKLTLSNGAKVIIKKTDFKDDEIQFAASANIGYAAYQNDPINAQNASAVWGLSGLGEFSSNDLEKALAGKQCGVDFSFSTFRHGLSGTTTPKDLETMMQLVYLNMTNVTKDQKAFDNMKNTYTTVLTLHINGMETLAPELSSKLHHTVKVQASKHIVLAIEISQCILTGSEGRSRQPLHRLACLATEGEPGTNTSFVLHLQSPTYSVITVKDTVIHKLIFIVCQNEMTAEASRLSPSLINAVNRIIAIYHMVDGINLYIPLSLVTVRIDDQMHQLILVGRDTEDGSMTQCRELCLEMFLLEVNGIVMRMGYFIIMTEWRGTLLWLKTQVSTQCSYGKGTVILRTASHYPMAVAETLQVGILIIIRCNTFLFSILCLLVRIPLSKLSALIVSSRKVCHILVAVQILLVYYIKLLEI